MNFGTVTEAACLNTVPAADERCSDPAFRLANPDICPLAPSLIIKPGIALACQLGSTQFRAFLVENGKETDVTATSTFTTSDPSLALVGVKSGNATGIAAGKATITAHYNDMTAGAEFNVLGCTGMQCDSTVAMLLLIDNSRSMGQAFSGGYSTKLAYAKEAAQAFAESVNTTKDLIGAMRFNSSGQTLLDSPTTDSQQVSDDIGAIPQSQQLTTFHDALEAAISELDATTADLKVLVLVSDGEDTTSNYTEDNNPLIPVDNFKAAGGIIMALGVRAHDKGFNLLEAIATGGFFINAYSATAATAIDYLKGIKGYICAGNCTPAGDEIVASGVSNYTDFVNWTVEQGLVDLLGNGFYDMLPGNGLYADLIGSPDLSPTSDEAILRSRTPFSLKSGHVYRVALDLAGNQVYDRSESVLLRVVSDSVTLLSQTITIGDYAQGFHTYPFSFTAPADMDVWIEIEHVPVTDGVIGGMLLGRVKFDDQTDLTNLMDDDFDGENLTYIPPRCGLASIYYGGGYASGYNCYGDGCLDEPPGVQLSDPSPLPDIESGFTPPTVFTATKNACATCGSGAMNLSTTNLVPAMTGPDSPSGLASASEENPVYLAWGAFDGTKPISGGIPHNSVWNVTAPTFPVWLQYDFAAAKTVRHYEITGSGVSSGFLAAPKDWTFQGSNDGSTWDDLDTVAGVSFFQGETKKFLVDSPASYLSYRLLITAGKSAGTVGIIEFAMFEAVEQSICETASAESTVSQSAADNAAYALALEDASAQLNCTTVYTATEQYTATCLYGLFPTTRSASAVSLNSQQEAEDAAVAAAKVLAEDARNCTQSTNEQEITINDNGIAAPYPSVQYISDVEGLVTKVELNLFGLSHFFSSDVLMVLQAPSGETCCIMANAGAAPFSGVDLVIKDDAATVIPASGVIASGSYKPTNSGGYTVLPAPGPAQPHGLLLAEFIGIDPNGQWALWILDDTPSNAGTLASWSLTITAA